MKSVDLKTLRLKRTVTEPKLSIKACKIDQFDDVIAKEDYVIIRIDKTERILNANQLAKIEDWITNYLDQRVNIVTIE